MRTLTSLLFFLCFFITPAQAIDLFQNDSKASVATVNGAPIKQSWIDFITLNAKNNNQNINQKALLIQLINDELVVQEALKQGIDKTPEFQVKQELNYRQTLANTFLADKFKNLNISDERIKKEYDEFKISLGPKEYKGSHILVSTEGEAQAIITQLAKGADFAKLAKEKSKDVKTAEVGGSMNWLNKNSPLGEALSKLPKGLYSTIPIQSRQGWHIIKSEDQRDLQSPNLDLVKEGLKNRIKQAEAAKFVADLREKAKIEYVNGIKK